MTAVGRSPPFNAQGEGTCDLRSNSYGNEVIYWVVYLTEYGGCTKSDCRETGSRWEERDVSLGFGGICDGRMGAMLAAVFFSEIAGIGASGGLDCGSSDGEDICCCRGQIFEPKNELVFYKTPYGTMEIFL